MKIFKFNLFSTCATCAVLFLATLFSCVPKEQVVFKGVNNIGIDMGADGKPVIKADVLFYNPNKMKMKLKDIDVEVFVDGNKSAEVKHAINLVVPPAADFSVPIVGTLSLKQSGFLDAVVGLLGGKKYEVVFKGNIRIVVHGITIKVPVAQKQELKLNL
ncbi:MAG: hypothetical protein JSS79_09525 [Bacteroidetes bacterium]|nr:hypothetical protein [Bacteroidota bacterium]